MINPLITQIPLPLRIIPHEHVFEPPKQEAVAHSKLPRWLVARFVPDYATLQIQLNVDESKEIELPEPSPKFSCLTPLDLMNEQPDPAPRTSLESHRESRARRRVSRSLSPCRTANRSA